MELHNYDQTSPWLLPCPFCGGMPTYHVKGNKSMEKRTLVVECGTCNVKMSTSALRLSDEWLWSIAIQKWNTRIKQK